MIRKITKGIASFLLVILTAKGIDYRFSDNWLKSIVGIAILTAALYFWLLKEIGSYIVRRKIRTVAIALIGFYCVLLLSENGDLTFSLKTIEQFLFGCLIGFPIVSIFALPVRFLVITLIGDIFSKPEPRTISPDFYDMSKYDREREEMDAKRAESAQRHRDRYDARTNELKARYDARTAASWGKDRAAQNFQNDADYWKKQQKKY